MMETVSYLSELAVGEGGSVAALSATGAMRRRLLDLGLVPGAAVTCVGKSPAGDPAAYLVSGAVIAIRKRDAADVTVRGQRRIWD